MRIPSATVVLATAACLGLASCTGGTPQTDAGDPRTLRYLIEEPEDAAALQALERHLGTFEKRTGITVEVNTLPFDSMRTVLQTQLRSGEGPDVFSWGSGPSFGGALAEAGLVHDLTEAYERRGWEVYDFAKERVTVDGKVYGIPGEMETIGLFYNEDVFAELGLEPPRSLGELEAVCRELRASGRVPLAVGDKEGWEGGHLLSMALSSAVGADGMEDLLAGRTSWDSPEVAAALDVWRDFERQGFLPRSPTSVDYDTSTSMFYSGKAAMIPTGSWLVGEIDDNADFEVGYVPFPAPGGPGVFTGGLGSGPYISATTPRKKAALELLDFLASPRHARWTVENLHTIPPMPLDTEGLDISPLFATVLRDTERLARGGDFGQNIDVLASDEVNEAMYDGVQGVLTGQRTPRQVAAELEEASAQR